MDNINSFVHLGDVKITTIRLNDLIIIMVKNEKIKEDIWCGVSRKVKSFEEITIIETLKTTWRESNY